MRNSLLLITLLTFSLLSCNKEKAETTPAVDPYELDPNPAGEKFNISESDSSAIAIADMVMEAMGGRKAWDSTQFISWNFFGRRDLVWDKINGRVRIDSPGDSLVYLININDKTGKVFKGGVAIADSTEKANLIERAYGIWVNDSYWLFMPFKLKDSGVTLKYAREDTTLNGVPSHVLQLTFQEVGVTPNNKYEVWVDKSDSLVKQWAFYREAMQDTASAIWPWDNYKTYETIKLSADRSDNRGPKNVKVHKSLPDSVFELLEGSI